MKSDCNLKNIRNKSYKNTQSTAPLEISDQDTNLYRQVNPERIYSTENKDSNNLYDKDSKSVDARKIEEISKDSDIDNKNIQNGQVTNDAVVQNNVNMYLAGIAAATGAGVVAGAGVSIASSEARSEAISWDLFSHFLQRNIQITEVKFLSAHNAGALAGHGTFQEIANQTMTIKDMLDRTPVRCFDLDVYLHNGELIVAHTRSGTLDPTVADSDLTKLQDLLNVIHNWQEQHPREVVLLNFEYHGEGVYDGVDSMLDHTFGKNSHAADITSFYQHGRAPTINELADNGVKILTPHSYYDSAGHATLHFYNRKFFYSGPRETVDNVWEDYSGPRPTVDNVWEDRDISQYLHGLHPEVAGKLTVEDIDRIVASKKGCVISLDHITPNDPRFFRPEDRDSLALKSGIEIFDQSISSDIANNLLMGLGTASASASVLLSTAMTTFQGYVNEMQIRRQDMIMPQQLAKVEMGSILAARAKNKKQAADFDSKILTEPITVEELKEAYKKDQIFKIRKSTALPGATAVVSISASMLSLGLIFPPLMLAFGIASGVAGLGLLAVAIITATNSYRLGKAIDKAFDKPSVKAAAEERIALMNRSIDGKLVESKLVGVTDVKLVFDKILKESEITDKLVVGSIISTSTSLLARLSGFAKYTMPIIGSVSAVICGIASIFSTAILATINFKERRKKLADISKTVTEQVMPNFAKKRKLKLAIFGKTALERFIKKDHKNLLTLLKLPANTSFKEAFIKLMLPENHAILNAYVEDFSFQKWNKDLRETAKQVYPKKDFDEITHDKQLLNNVCKRYIKNNIGKFASRNTWITGGLGVFSLMAVSCFCGMLILPFIGVLLAVVVFIVGGSTTKLVAMKESKRFISRFNNIIDADPKDLNNEDLWHRKEFERLLFGWGKLFYKSDTDDIDLAKNIEHDDLEQVENPEHDLELDENSELDDIGIENSDSTKL